MLSVVSVDIVPADIPAAYAPAMAAACTEALSEGRCALASTLPESAQPDAVALVLWKDGDYREVTVRVGRGNGQWVVRSLTFADADSVPERWVTVGLTVATLVGESQPELPGASQTATPSKSQEAPRATPAPRERHRFDTALGLLAGPGWTGGGPQYGAWLSAGIRLSTLPLAFHAFGSYALSSGPEINGGNPRTSWATAGISGMAVGTLHALNVQASGGLELAFRKVQADLNGQSAQDAEVPLRLRVLASYPADSRAGFIAGAILRIPPIGSGESDEAHLRGPGLSLELLAGIKVQL
ncbi:MAG TPA: hypothetical protein VG937_26910 [Polyangiaceae bacterium]|nr:hypothetical protein [Polyangiaceae bacterium]